MHRILQFYIVLTCNIYVYIYVYISMYVCMYIFSDLTSGFESRNNLYLQKLKIKKKIKNKCLSESKTN